MLPLPFQSEILDRMPPSDVDAELQVLGSVLLKPSILDELADVLGPEDFNSEAHGHLLQTLFELRDARKPLEPGVIRSHMRPGGDWEPSVLAEAMQSVGTWQHWKHLATVIRQHSQRRQIIHSTIELLRSAYDTTVSVDTVLGAAETALGAIQTGDYDSRPVTMWDAVGKALARIDEIVARGEGFGMATGLSGFDEQLGGVYPGELTIIAARPSQGKTSLALQMAAHQAAKGKCVYFATLEMTDEELATKRLCTNSGVSNQKIRSGTIDADDQARLVEASQTTARKNFHLHDWPEIRPADIMRAARRLKAEIIYVDYLQIVTPPDDSKKRYEQVGDISRGLKVMAARLKVPVVACCQIGRQSEQYKETRPRLSHLRESGNIENDADVVLLLWRPKNGIKGKDDGDYATQTWSAEMEVGKNRKGVTPTLRLDFVEEETLFRCVGEPYYDDDGGLDEEKHGWTP